MAAFNAFAGCALASLALACTAELDAPGTAAGGTGGVGSTASSGGSANTDPSVCVPGVPVTSQLPRLTNEQYENTVFDLVGLQGSSTMLAPDTESVDQRAWDGYRAAAQAVAAQVMADSLAKARLVTCTPEGDGTACAAQIIQSFGRRAFRRPLTSLELERFSKLYAERAALTAAGSFDEAIELILKAMLLSPSFLLRAETAELPAGKHLALSSFEVASRLSYLLLGSMPDDALFEAAAQGTLATAEQVRSHAVRLLEQDPRARRTVERFHQRYLHKGPGTRWADYQRDASLYPAFVPDLVSLLSQETDRFLNHVVFEQGGSFRDLVTSPVAFVNASSAPLYGLDPAQYGAELVQVTLDASQRPGVFTRAGFLAAHALVNRSSPILRGAFLQKHVLCSNIGAPPPGAEGTPLPELSLSASNRERVDAQTSSPECAGCHQTIINPTGFALEGFDAAGGTQLLDPFSGGAVDTTARVVIAGESVAVSGPAQLFDAIGSSPQANLCYARAWVQLAYERELTSQDSCVAEELAARLTGSGYRILDLIADLTQAESFRHRAVPAEVAP